MTMRPPRAAAAGACRPAPPHTAGRRAVFRTPAFAARTPVLAVQATLAALALTACTTAVTPAPLPLEVREPPPTTVRALHRLVADGAPGAASLITHDGDFHAARFSTAGVSDLRSGRPMGPGDHFRAGSLTKTVIATVILQLVAEGKLALDDTAAGHLPAGVPATGTGEKASDLRRVTIRQLLSHTSGLFNYTEDPRLSRQLSGNGFGAHRYDSHTPAELLRIALSHPQVTAPGTGPHHQHGPHGPHGRGGGPFAYSYSNTNYLVLGLIIGEVTGHRYSEEVRRRVITPVGLGETTFPGTDPVLPAPHGRAYSRIGDRQVDTTSLDPSRAGAAGEMITTLGDLNRFFAALLGGKLLPPRQMAQLRNEKISDGTYGLGLYATELPCGRTVWGHNGDINGSYAQTAGTADGRRLLSYRINTDTLTKPGDGTAVLEAEFCPPTRSRKSPDGKSPGEKSPGRAAP